MVLEFPILADYCVIADSGTTVYATHGHVYNANNLPPLSAGDILLHGHTHVPERTAKDGITILNPGSVSIPKNDSHQGYMILENGIFTWKDLEGNIITI